MTIVPFDPTRDGSAVCQLWATTLGHVGWSLEKDRLLSLFDRPFGYHKVLRYQEPGQKSANNSEDDDGRLVGFAALYTHPAHENATNDLIGYLSVILIHPDFQNQGLGTKLYNSCISFLEGIDGVKTLVLGSCFPRFFPGIPTNLPQKDQDFFKTKGWTPQDQLAYDYFQSLETYVAPTELLNKLKANGITYKPWSPELYDQMMIMQRSNFSTYPGWVEAYDTLYKCNRTNEAMCAFDNDGNIIGATLMLSDDLNNPVRANLAWPSIIGDHIGNIGCVGIDSNSRRGGVGQGMLASALINMKERGLSGSFVDSLVLTDWYSKAGFGPWAEYRQYKPHKIDNK